MLFRPYSCSLIFKNERNINVLCNKFHINKVRDDIEKKYQKKSLLEHILHRPDSYVGSLSRVVRSMWVYDVLTNKIVKKDISFSPGFFKIFDEILVNAVDNKIRDSKTSYIKINIDKVKNTVSVTNDGCGIPVIMHSQEGIYVPSLIFGHLLTSSNYDDSDDKYTGGRNGFGAKLCNIFSSEFTVETSSANFGYSFKQTWKNNMTSSTEPIIEPSTLSDFTKITFTPDLSRFDMQFIDSDIMSLFQRRAFDIASCTKDLSVYFNDDLISVQSFNKYVELYQSDEANEVVYKRFNDKWEVAICVSPNDAFSQMSFVNGINTSNGGQHVNFVMDKLLSKLIELVKVKINNSSIVIKPQYLKNCIAIFINCFIKNPTFESQSKDCLTLLPKHFGSTLSITDEFVTDVANCGVLNRLESILAVKGHELKRKVSVKKTSYLNDITKLDDAIFAGTKRSKDCTLILTEGDSAKALALSGLSVIGKNYYGVYPLKGKLLNVTNVVVQRIANNVEFGNLVRILGLNYNTQYTTTESLNTLRYGKIMIMVDQDHDGSHIKGLLINFLYFHWPELMSHGFLEQFITPLLKAFKGNSVQIFFSDNEYQQWRQVTPDVNTWRIKYYKGLGTSTSTEAKEYFANIDRHRIPFVCSESDVLKLKMAFDKKEPDQRKVWLTDWMERRKANKVAGLANEDIYDKKVSSISYSDFVDKELVQYFIADNVRSIPSLMDGLKTSQRKILYTCLKRDLKKEIKVAQLAGSVAELSAYHHGELTLNETIIGLAQDYVGSNNISLLIPVGQFGTRVYGGKDNASARYLFTQLSPLTRVIFNPLDDPLLSYNTDNNTIIEPEWYAPIIPMILVNGCEGIGSGWRSIIPAFNPQIVITNIRRLLEDEELLPMNPWYRHFCGEIQTLSPNRYISCGRIEQVDKNTFLISELPLKQWTQNYRDRVLKRLSSGMDAFIKRFEDHSTDTAVKIIVYMNPLLVEKAQSKGLEKLFQLKSYLNTREMILFDEHGTIKKFESAEDILRSFYRVRLPIYDRRKSYIESKLSAEYRRYANQYRFIKENIEGIISMGKVTEEDLEIILVNRQYESDPIKEWKKSRSLINITENVDSTDENGDEKGYPDYNYLTGIRLKSLTVDNVVNLDRLRKTKREELGGIEHKSSGHLWLEDLKDLEQKLEEYYR